MDCYFAKRFSIKQILPHYAEGLFDLGAPKLLKIVHFRSPSRPLISARISNPLVVFEARHLDFRRSRPRTRCQANRSLSLTDYLASTFGFLAFFASPSSISRRMASCRPGLSGSAAVRPSRIPAPRKFCFGTKRSSDCELFTQRPAAPSFPRFTHLVAARCADERRWCSSKFQYGAAIKSVCPKSSPLNSNGADLSFAKA